MRAEARQTEAARSLGLLAIGAVCLIALALLAAASPALAVEEKVEVTHLYNEAHSLTGGCSVSAADKVPDPACSEVPQGPLPPEGPLMTLHAATVDAYGNQYVANGNPSQGPGTFNIDIFDPEGRYIGGFGTAFAVGTIAVDTTGHLYVGSSSDNVLRYDPTTYNPKAGEIAYGSPAVLVSAAGSQGIAVDSVNDHFYINKRTYVTEYGPPTTGVPNEVLTEEIGKGVLRIGDGGPGPVAIDAQHNRLYVTDEPASFEPGSLTIDAFSATAPYGLLEKFDGSTTPAGVIGHSAQANSIALAVDEKSGNFFFSFQGRVHELEPDGTYVATVRKPVQQTGTGSSRQIAYDNSDQSPNQGYLYVPTGQAEGHLYAYEPIQPPAPPVIEAISFDGVAEDEAVLHAKVNPAGEPTHYVFEYVTEQNFDESEFANAQVLGDGETAGSGEGVEVSAVARGLQPGATYRFRVRAENQCETGGCAVEAQSVFTTFAPYAQSGSCANQALRIGNSAALPDCRAYELVSPPDTGGRAPFTLPASRFAFWTGSPDGSSVAFNGDGGAFPGQDTPGGYNGDTYVSRRAASGWITEAAGLLGRQSASQVPGGLSPDHGFSMVTSFPAANLEGELGGPGENADYLRYPDGSVHLVGEGSIGQARHTGPALISAGGSHIVFTAEETQLEPNAPPAGTNAIYDRTPDGTLHVVSLLPGEITPTEDARYEGASTDGSSVAFKIGGGGPMYLRLDNAQTVEAAPAGATFAGLSEAGRYLFYLAGGDLYRYDTQAEVVVALSEDADVTPAYVSADGSTAYFTSKAVLTTEEGPNGTTAVAGQNNLYLAREGELHFVATVTERDVKGEFLFNDFARGFSDWLKGPKRAGMLPLRASADGEALLFESRADLTKFKSSGKAQIFRYDATQATLDCLSCDPTGKAPLSDASLLSPDELQKVSGSAPISVWSIVPNLSKDGRRAFFESAERLVPADEDGLKDVYEWEAQGKGSCAQESGCVFLISSGQSSQNDYLYGASESGDDVFIYTADLLNGEDVEEAPSIYDARVQGGFPPRQAAVGECLGEACQPAAVAPNDPTPASSAFEGSGNVKPEGEAKARCPKGKKAARRGGKTRCVPRHHHKKQHKRAKNNRRAGR